MRISNLVSVLAITAAAFATSHADTLWVYGEQTLLTPNVGWTTNGAAAEVDTPTNAAYAGSFYINFDDSLVGYYAGFGIVWDNWNTNVDATGYNGLTFAFKGAANPLKLVVEIQYAGADSVNNVKGKNWCPSISGLNASWRKIAVQLPDSVPKKNIRCINFGLGGVQTAPKNNFKLDEVGFVNMSSSVAKPISGVSAPQNRSGFVPSANGMVVVSTYSTNGALLSKRRSAVTAGNHYSTSQFVDASPLPRIVRISGAGVAVTETVTR